MDTLGDYGWDDEENPEIVKKYAPIVKALKAPDMWVRNCLNPRGTVFTD